MPGPDHEPNLANDAMKHFEELFEKYKNTEEQFKAMYMNRFPQEQYDALKDEEASKLHEDVRKHKRSKESYETLPI